MKIKPFVRIFIIKRIYLPCKFICSTESWNQFQMFISSLKVRPLSQRYEILEHLDFPLALLFCWCSVLVNFHRYCLQVIGRFTISLVENNLECTIYSLSKAYYEIMKGESIRISFLMSFSTNKIANSPIILSCILMICLLTGLKKKRNIFSTTLVWLLCSF